MDKIKLNPVTAKISGLLEKEIRKVQIEFSKKANRNISKIEASEVLVYMYITGIDPQVIQRHMKKGKKFAMVI